MIAIVDYDAGNMRSVINALSKLNAEFFVAKDGGELSDADAIIIPGVGAFDYAMNILKERNFIEPIKKASVPILGICLGQQVLFASSEEGKEQGLSLISGCVKKLKAENKKLPNMGWTNVVACDNPLFKGIENEFFYFVHSYACFTDNEKDAIGISEYGEKFASAAHFKNVYGVQFHPEKSGAAGLKLLSNFLSIVKNAGEKV